MLLTKCAQYNVARNTKRWPKVILFDLLNVSCNKDILHFQIQQSWKPKKKKQEEHLYKPLPGSLSSRKSPKNHKLQVSQYNWKWEGRRFSELKTSHKSLITSKTTELVAAHCVIEDSRQEVTKELLKCGRKVCSEHSSLVCVSCY